VVLPEPSLALGFTWLLLSIDLLPAVLGDPGGQAGAESLEGAPQPPGAPVELALHRQPREQAGPVAPDLGQPGGLRAAAEQEAPAGIQNLEQRRPPDAGRASFLVSAVPVSRLS
jgi:hypothetical protein